MQEVKLFTPKYHNKTLISKQEVIKCLKECKKNIIPVIDKNQRPIGIIDKVYIKNNCIYGSVFSDCNSIEGTGIINCNTIKIGSRHKIKDAKIVYFLVEDNN